MGTVNFIKLVGLTETPAPLSSAARGPAPTPWDAERAEQEPRHFTEVEAAEGPDTVVTGTSPGVLDPWARGSAPTPWDEEAARQQEFVRQQEALKPKTPEQKEKEKKAAELGRGNSVAKAYVRSTGRTDEKRWASTFNLPPVYAIIGRGFTAVVNLATLLRSEEGRRRVGDQTIFLIGFRDPWLGYKKHEMNQEREVMTLPGFTNQLDEQPVNGLYVDRLHNGVTREVPYVQSDAFADATQAELDLLLNEAKEAGYKVEVLTAVVDRITLTAAEEKGEKSATDDPPPPYVLHLEGQRGAQDMGTLRAQFVDICVGPGQSRILPGEGRYGLKMPSQLRHQYENPPRDTDSWSFPIVCAASEFTRENCRTLTGAMVLVQGAGPAAAQACEECIRMGAAEVLWVSKESFARAFIPNLRVDFLANMMSGPDERPLPAAGDSTREIPDTATLVPRVPGLWMGKGLSAKEIQWTGSGRRVLVTFDANVTRGRTEGEDEFRERERLAKADPNSYKVVGLGNTIELLPNKQAVFDQVIIAQGRENNIEVPGSPGYLLRELVAGVAPKVEFEPLTHAGIDFPLGVASKDGAKRQIRLLGSSGLSSAKPQRGVNTPPNWIETMNKGAFDELTAYQNSLPSQSRVFYQGVTLAGVTIAYANGYFDPANGRYNTNRNTATERECNALAPATNAGLQSFMSRLERMRVYLTRLDGLGPMYTPAEPVPHAAEVRV